MSKFSLRRISYLLKAKIYEQHGLTKKQYIKLCRDAWGHDNGILKVITDRKYPLSISEITKKAGYHLDFAIEEYLKKIEDNPITTGEEFVQCVYLMLNDYQSETFTNRKLPPINYPEFWSDKTIQEGEYFITFFDVLGFEKLVEKKTPLEVYEIYENIVKKARANRPYTVTAAPAYGEGQPAITIPEFISVPFKYAYYSDSIIFWTPGYPENLSGFIAKCADFFIWALRSQVLLRGTVSYGKAILNRSKNIFIGQPLVEAVRLEKEQQWAGFTFGESIYENGLLSHCSDSLLMYNYAHSLKRVINEKIFHVSVNWMSRLDLTEYKRFKEILDKLYVEAPEKAKQYIVNTKNFLYYYYIMCNLPSAVSRKINGPADLPQKINISIEELRTHPEMLLSVIFIEGMDNKVTPGFIFLTQPQTYEYNPHLKDFLPFIDILEIKEYAHFLMTTGGDQPISQDKTPFVQLIDLKNIKDIYW